MVAFVPNNDRNVYRLSFIKQTPKLVNNKIDWDHSNPKRYSFLLGVDQHVKTPQKYLGKRVSNIEELEACLYLEKKPTGERAGSGLISENCCLESVLGTPRDPSQTTVMNTRELWPQVASPNL